MNHFSCPNPQPEAMPPHGFHSPPSLRGKPRGFGLSSFLCSLLLGASHLSSSPALATPPSASPAIPSSAIFNSALPGSVFTSPAQLVSNREHIDPPKPDATTTQAEQTKAIAGEAGWAFELEPRGHAPLPSRPSQVPDPEGLQQNGAVPGGSVAGSDGVVGAGAVGAGAVSPNMASLGEAGIVAEDNPETLLLASMVSGKVIGGSPNPDPGRYGLVYLAITTAKKEQFRCAGTAVGKEWILTSNHCIEQATKEIRVFASAAHLAQWRSGIVVDGIRRVSNPAIQPDEPGTDLAILHVPHLPANITPVPILGAGQPENPTLIGIGSGQHRLNPLTGQWERVDGSQGMAIPLPLQPRPLCLGGLQDSAIICAGEPWQPLNRAPRADFCTGDSGSPIGVFDQGRFVLVGIESRSSINGANPNWATLAPQERCGFAPTIGTNVRAHLPFIQETAGADGVETVALPTPDLPHTNTLDIGPAHQGIDLRVPSTKNIPAEGTRIALQIANIRHHHNPRLGRHVLLASNQSFADSLTSAALQREAILLLTDKNQLSQANLDRLATMGTRQVTILGGVNTVSDLVVHQLHSLGIKVDRIAGADRLDTAAAMAHRVLAQKGAGDGAYLVRAYGEGSAAFADSLAAGAAAARRNWPILLTSTDQLAAPTRNLLKGRAQTTIVGGPAAISPQVRAQVAALVPSVTNAQGANRAQTAELLADSPNPSGSVIIIDGFDPGAWHAGFAASGLAYDLDAPILLVNPATKGRELAGHLNAITPKPGASFVCVADQPLCNELYTTWLN